MLKYGTNSNAVVQLRASLNVASSTRLPRLAPSTLFDWLTMARVMEYQHTKKLTADGVVGKKTERSFALNHGNTQAPHGRAIVVDLIGERLSGFESGVQQFQFTPIKGGSFASPSTRGVFKVYKRLRHHTSSSYPEPPGNMDYSLFFQGPEAIHQGPPTVPSHGCIHVHPRQAAQLFTWAGNSDLIVIVLKLTR